MIKESSENKKLYSSVICDYRGIGKDYGKVFFHPTGKSQACSLAFSYLHWATLEDFKESQAMLTYVV